MHVYVENIEKTIFQELLTADASYLTQLPY